LRAAFDAAALRAATEQVLADIAAERYPGEAGERRALFAELNDHARDLFARIADLERAEAALGASEDSERFVLCRAWSAALRNVFRSADESWIEIHPVVSDGRRGKPSFWKRLFGRKQKGGSGRKPARRMK
jgi:hypothetical protein